MFLDLDDFVNVPQHPGYKHLATLVTPPPIYTEHGLNFERVVNTSWN
jgi:hypothetical protein